MLENELSQKSIYHHKPHRFLLYEKQNLPRISNLNHKTKNYKIDFKNDRNKPNVTTTPIPILNSSLAKTILQTFIASSTDATFSPVKTSAFSFIQKIQKNFIWSIKLINS